MSTDTNCRKCKAPMTPINQRGTTTIDRMIDRMTITGYRCQECGHFNDLKRRKKAQTK